MNWLLEQFDLLSRGGGMVVTALFRLGLVALGLWIAYGMIRTFFANPIKMSRGVLAVLVGLVICWGVVILVPKYVYPVGGFGLLVLGYLAFCAAAKVAAAIIGEDDQPKDSKDVPSGPP